MKFIMVMICLICGLEFESYNNIQKYCSKGCYEINQKEYQKEYQKDYQKEYYQNNKEEINEYGKEYRQDNKEESKEYYQDNKEQIKKYQQEYYQDNKEKINEHQKEYKQTPKGKEVRKRANAKRVRNLGFNPLNEWFEGSHGHHLDEINVIYVPTELHESIRHSVTKNRNMDEINIKAWVFLESQSY